MLSKCANPGCPTSFRYLHEGKLFRIHVDPFASESDSTSGIGADRKKPARRVEFFWLCQDCSAKMTLSFEKGVGVTIQPVTRVHAMAS
jgi:hypothetical protein